MSERFFGPCEKCGHRNISVRWMFSWCYIESHGNEEHFCLSCRRCGYRWREPV